MVDENLERNVCVILLNRFGYKSIYSISGQMKYCMLIVKHSEYTEDWFIYMTYDYTILIVVGQ